MRIKRQTKLGFGLVCGGGDRKLVVVVLVKK